VRKAVTEESHSFVPLPLPPIKRSIFVVRQESEVTMVEALTKLANVHDVISTSLEPVAASGGGSPGFNRVSSSPKPQSTGSLGVNSPRP
jgi:hypothetical protein